MRSVNVRHQRLPRMGELFELVVVHLPATLLSGAHIELATARSA